MKIPLKWLAEYVPVVLGPAQLAERLTTAGLEISGTRVVGLPVPAGLRIKPEDATPVWEPDKVLIARIVRVEKHPNADKLKLVTLDYGNPEPKVVVTGAPNIAIGESETRVVVGLVGTKYYKEKDGKRGFFELQPGELRGIKSDAMVMSEYELGVSEDHEGIIRLPADAPVGQPYAEYAGDIVLEADVLPNMARCLSMIGVAREVAALTGQFVKLPPTELSASSESIEGQVRVVIDNPDASARYAAMLIRNVTHGESPPWMRQRLALAGMRPVSNIVDVTNYVMLEWGQPLHAFDYDVLRQRAGGQPPTITVRLARPGETLVTLDDQTRKLSAEHVVIADDLGPIALAGVMGGKETEVTAQTRNVLLESASFDFVRIRRTYKEFNLPSEASSRFAKGVPSELVLPAAMRAARLLAEWAGGQVCAGVVDVYPKPQARQTVHLRQAEIGRLLGESVPATEVEQILSSLDFTLSPTSDGWQVTVPSHRIDIQDGPADLIEEIARIRGYERLPATLLRDELPEQKGNPGLAVEEHVRDMLVAAGLQEVITYSLTTPEREAGFVNPGAEYVKLINPISADRAVMRRAILPSVLEVVAANLRHTSTVAVFEIGKVYHPVTGQTLPDEFDRVAIAMTGPRTERFWTDPVNAQIPTYDFFDLKGLLEGFVEDVHLPPALFEPTAPLVEYLHPGRQAQVCVNGEVVGRFGELHPRLARSVAREFDGRSVLVADLDLGLLVKYARERFPYAPIPQFPPALRDIAIVLDESVNAAAVVGEIRTAAGDLLRAATLFDVYRGEAIGAGKKSLAYALTYQSTTGTLNDKEIDKLHKKVEERLTRTLGAKVRGRE